MGGGGGEIRLIGVTWMGGFGWHPKTGLGVSLNGEKEKSALRQCVAMDGARRKRNTTDRGKHPKRCMFVGVDVSGVFFHATVTATEIALGGA